MDTIHAVVEGFNGNLTWSKPEQLLSLILFWCDFVLVTVFAYGQLVVGREDVYNDRFWDWSRDYSEVCERCIERIQMVSIRELPQCEVTNKQKDYSF